MDGVSADGDGCSTSGIDEEDSAVDAPIIVPVATVTGKEGGTIAAGDGAEDSGGGDTGSSCLEGRTMRATSAILVLRRKIVTPGGRDDVAVDGLGIGSSFFSSVMAGGSGNSDLGISSLLGITRTTGRISVGRLTNRTPPERVRARKLSASAIACTTSFFGGAGSIGAIGSVGAGTGISETVVERGGTREAIPPVPGIARCRDSRTLDLSVGALEAGVGARTIATGFTFGAEESADAGLESSETGGRDEGTAGSSFRWGVLVLKKI